MFIFYVIINLKKFSLKEFLSRLKAYGLEQDSNLLLPVLAEVQFLNKYYKFYYLYFKKYLPCFFNRSIVGTLKRYEDVTLFIRTSNYQNFSIYREKIKF